MKQKTAHWIKKTHLFRTDEYICSECGQKSLRPVPVCPACKCRMKNCRYDPSWIDEAEVIDAVIDD